MQNADWIRLLGEVAGFLVVGCGLIVAVRVQVAVISTKVDFMALELAKITGILERLAGFDEKFRSVDQRLISHDGRLNRVENRVEELAHGESFVLPLKKSPYEHGG